MLFSAPWFEDQITRSQLRNPYVNDAIRSPVINVPPNGKHVNDNSTSIDMGIAVDS